MRIVNPQQLQLLQQSSVTSLLDVRTPAEHAEIHVPGAHLVPLDRLDPAKLASVDGFAKDKPLYVLCRSGNRAKQAAQRLEEEGFTQCHIVEGGMVAWEQAGLPINRGESKVIPLERQVRIAAGAVVLTGVLLARFVHPSFIWLSGFIGVGLVFAGVTDWCGMGLLLARMPWNQRGDTGACCSAK